MGTPIQYKAGMILELGVYRVRDWIAPNDPELEPGLLEVYEHPMKGLCFWDQSVTEDSDGHIPIARLDGEELTRVETP